MGFICFLFMTDLPGPGYCILKCGDVADVALNLFPSIRLIHFVDELSIQQGVTRMTSSGVVRPARAFFNPSTRIER